MIFLLLHGISGAGNSLDDISIFRGSYNILLKRNLFGWDGVAALKAIIIPLQRAEEWTGKSLS